MKKSKNHMNPSSVKISAEKQECPAFPIISIRIIFRRYLLPENMKSQEVSQEKNDMGMFTSGGHVQGSTYSTEKLLRPSLSNKHHNIS